MEDGVVLAISFKDVVADAPVIGVAAIARGDVEHAVRTEIDPVAIVIELRPVDLGDRHVRY